MFVDRPVWGYGSGSFVDRVPQAPPAQLGQTLSASHTIPITIAAEQGLIGEIAYIALVLVAALVAAAAARAADPAAGGDRARRSWRCVFHTLLYADFLEDPITWTLLAIGAALAATRARQAEAGAVASDDVAAVAA